MQLYEQKFEDALSYLSRPDILHPTGDKPICYVNYDVEDAMEVYRMINSTLVPKAKYHGFADVRVVSLGNEIQQYIKNHDYHQPEFWGIALTIDCNLMSRNRNYSLRNLPAEKSYSDNFRRN